MYKRSFRHFQLFAISLAISGLIIVSSPPTTSIYKTRSNPILIDVVGEHYPIPDNFTDIELRSANVLHDITASKTSGNFTLRLSASYIFYNPNETSTLRIALPFSLPPQNYPFQVNVSNQPVSYENITSGSYIRELTGSQRSYWENFFDTYSNIALFLFDAVLESNRTTQVDVSLDGNIVAETEAESIEFAYFLGSAAAWSGSLTELVQFITWDRRPNNYGSWPKQPAYVTEETRGERVWGNYSWFFEDMTIDSNQEVWVRFSNPDYVPYEMDNNDIPSFGILAALLSISTLWIWKHKRKGH